MNPWLVVGLGNPGPGYAKHRHNVGHLVVDRLVARASAKLKAPLGMRAELAELRVGPPGPDSRRMVVAKSRTFMNETGGPVAKLIKYYKITPESLIVVHDELDLDPGRLRVKFGGGDNGHNGLKSLRSSLGTGDFYRVRSGIGRPPGRQQVADFVLSNYSSTERKELPFEVDRAADAVETLVLEGLERTQQKFNS